jgi:hypothetical protein
MNPDLQSFLHAWTGGADVSDVERERLLQRFENDAALRAECAEEIRLLGMIKAAQSPSPRWLDLHDALNVSSATPEDAADDLASRVLDRLRVEPLKSVGSRWLSWRPLTAAAAGLVIGMFCTSVVFGFGVRSLERVVSLLRESFESGPAPMVTGVPQELNLWSGDYSEIVDSYEGVKPEQGTKMARLLRSDFEGRTVPLPSRQGDLMRVVDVRPFQSEANGADVVLTLSALFNAVTFPATERYDGMVTIYALGADTDLRGATEDSVKEDALAFSVGRFPALDRVPSTWQPASTRLLLPAGTAFVMLKASVCRMPMESKSLSSLPESVTFAGHFVDDVRASIRIRDAVPNQRAQAVTQVAK